MLDANGTVERAGPAALSQSPSNPTEEQDDPSLHIFGVFRALLRHRWKIALILLASFLAAHLYLKQTRPLYTALTEVILEEGSAPVDLGEALLPSGSSTEIQTELQVIRSRSVLQAAIETLDLLRDPEFNPTAPAPEPSGLEGWLIERELWPIDVSFSWPPKVTTGVAREPVAYRADARILRLAVDRLREKTRVSSIRGTTIIQLNVTAWTPKKAALIANAIMDAYVASRIEVKVEAQRFASQFIGSRIVELREEVEAAEAKVQSFRAENAVVSDAGEEVTRYEELQNRADGAQTLLRDLSTRLTRFEDALTSPEGLRAAASALDDRRINALIAAGYDEEIRSEIEEVAARLKADQQVAVRRAEALSKTLADLESSLEAGSANLVRVRQLEREAEASRQLFGTFLARQKETAVQQDLAKPDARVLTAANAPYNSSSPNKKQTYAIAGILGLVIASFLVLLLERGRNRFVNIEELEAYTGHSVLGSVPRHKKAYSRRSIVNHVRNAPGGAIAEAVRNLRTSILLANVDSPPKVVVFTSSVPEEGKSLTTLLLGMVTAQMGKRAILIDADIRRRTLHRTLRIKSEPGLIGLLNGSARREDAIKIDPESGMHALPVEKTRVSAPDLLASEAFAKLISDLREDYDLILIDAPPVLPVTDARILAKLADALVYVVKWNDTPRDIVRHGLASLNGIGAHISGLVLSQVDRDKQRKYGYGYHGYYGYGSYKYYKKADRYYTE